MSALNLSKVDITAYDGTPVRLVYDQEADSLEVFFGANEPATGVDLTDHIVLRLNQQTKRAVSLPRFAPQCSRESRRLSGG